MNRPATTTTADPGERAGNRAASGATAIGEQRRRPGDRELGRLEEAAARRRRRPQRVEVERPGRRQPGQQRDCAETSAQRVSSVVHDGDCWAIANVTKIAEDLAERDRESRSSAVRTCPGSAPRGRRRAAASRSSMSSPATTTAAVIPRRRERPDQERRRDRDRDRRGERLERRAERPVRTSYPAGEQQDRADEQRQRPCRASSGRSTRRSGPGRRPAGRPPGRSARSRSCTGPARRRAP